MTIFYLHLLLWSVIAISKTRMLQISERTEFCLSFTGFTTSFDQTNICKGSLESSQYKSYLFHWQFKIQWLLLMPLAFKYTTVISLPQGEKKLEWCHDEDQVRNQKISPPKRTKWSCSKNRNFFVPEVGSTQKGMGVTALQIRSGSSTKSSDFSVFFRSPLSWL